MLPLEQKFVDLIQEIRLWTNNFVIYKSYFVIKYVVAEKKICESIVV